MKTLSVIKKELQEKNIVLNDITIKNNLEKIRNESFVNDKEYINLLYKEKIDFLINGKEILDNIF